MALPSDQLKLIFRKLLQGTATEEEKQLIANYLQQEKTEIDLDLLLPYEEWDAAKAGVLPDQIRKRVLSSILPKKRPVIIRWLSGVAAAIVIAIASLLFPEQRKEPAQVTVVAAKGAHRSVVLPDHSIIHLNAGSQVTFPAKFTGKERRVQLTGEAFFEVAPDHTKPFIVQTGAINTTVLGTTFNVQAYAGDEAVAVTVTTGKVKVEANNRMVVLTPGLRTVYGKNKGSFTVGKADTTTVTGWRQNRLVFEDASLGELCKILGRHYNVEFKAADPAVLNSKYSATFNQLSLEESLDKLRLLGDLQFRQEGNTITIKH
jgi:transmembrane sensor